MGFIRDKKAEELFQRMADSPSIGLSDLLGCQHPINERWQCRDAWQCCLCGRAWWGNKNKLPAKDMYGKAT